MLFEKSSPLKILTCDACRATGAGTFTGCRVCGKMAMGRTARGKWLFFDYPLTRYHLLLQRGRRILNKVRWISVLIIGLNFWLWCGLLIYRRGLYRNFSPNPRFWLASLSGRSGLDFYFNLPPDVILLFWFGAVCLAYVYYRSVRERNVRGKVEHHTYRDNETAPEKNVSVWGEVKKIPRRLRHNIADAMTFEALAALGEGYFLADKNNHAAYLPEHLFYTLLSNNRIGNIFIRLGILTKTVEERMSPVFDEKKTARAADPSVMPLPSPDLLQVVFQAYEEAFNAHQDYVSVADLFLVAVKESPRLQEILYDLGVEKNKLVNVVEWARVRERLYRQYVEFRRAASRRPKSGMDRAMTALSTPNLNHFGEDMTLMSQMGALDVCVAREKEMDEIFRAISGGAANILLTGEPGVGKKSIIEGLSEKMVEDDVPARLRDKRLVRLSTSALLAGTTPSGALERLQIILNEVRRAGNVILFIHNIHELMGVSAGGGETSLDVAGTLAEHLGSSGWYLFATATAEAYTQQIANTSLGNVFTRVEVKEMNENQAIQVLESKVGRTEYKQNVFFSYGAIEKAVQLAGRFLHDEHLPGSALQVMAEAAVLARNKKGVNALVMVDEVTEVVAEKTHIPVTSVSADESSKLLHLEEMMHKSVIGQDEAVDAVANALRRARAEIRSVSRPIANFLFLGPTGVGKTELAKTIAKVYFGGEDKMVRLDMSEYQDKTSIYRLIGAPGEKGTGILTEAVRHAPFTLLLLDEIEKADKDILNLFLQVMDDGRLTDSTGRTVDFTNVIIIATSNAGTSYVSDQIKAGLSSEAIKERLLHGELRQYFRPEFLNRFDGIVLFKSLDRGAIKKVASLMLARVGKDLEAKGFELKFDDAALEFLADVGFDPEFGARPMRRAIQERVENKLAELVLSKKLKRRDVVTLGAGGEMKIEKG